MNLTTDRPFKGPVVDPSPFLRWAMECPVSTIVSDRASCNDKADAVGDMGGQRYKSVLDIVVTYVHVYPNETVSKTIIVCGELTQTLMFFAHHAPIPALSVAEGRSSCFGLDR